MRITPKEWVVLRVLLDAGGEIATPKGGVRAMLIDRARTTDASLSAYTSRLREQGLLVTQVANTGGVDGKHPTTVRIALTERGKEVARGPAPPQRFGRPLLREASPKSIRDQGTVNAERQAALLRGMAAQDGRLKGLRQASEWLDGLNTGTTHRVVVGLEATGLVVRHSHGAYAALTQAGWDMARDLGVPVNGHASPNGHSPTEPEPELLIDDPEDDVVIEVPPVVEEAGPVHDPGPAKSPLGFELSPATVDPEALADALLALVVKALGEDVRVKADLEAALSMAERTEEELAQVRDRARQAEKHLKQMEWKFQQATAQTDEVKRLQLQVEKLTNQLAYGAKEYQRLKTEMQTLRNENEELKVRPKRGRYRLSDYDPAGAEQLAELARIMQQVPTVKGD